MRSILLACIVIALAAMAAPHLVQTYVLASATPKDGAAGSRVDASGQARRGGTAAPRSVSIAAAANGHFYVDAEVNLRTVAFLVDTGATVVALRESDALDAGIRVGHADFVHPVQTANGETMAAEAVLDSVRVDDVEVLRIRALVLPDDKLSVSLLGGSFLHGLRRFEVASGTLVLEN